MSVFVNILDFNDLDGADSTVAKSVGLCGLSWFSNAVRSSPTLSIDMKSSLLGGSKLLIGTGPPGSSAGPPTFGMFKPGIDGGIIGSIVPDCEPPC